MAKDTKRRSPPREPKYRRRTLEKRITIQALWKEGFSMRHMAERVGCSPSTVSRELGRNVSQKGYRPKKADAKARFRASAKAGEHRTFTAEMWALALANLRKGWTFGQTSGRCRRDGLPMVCKETLYLEYYRRQKAGESLPPLPMRRRKRKARDGNAKKYRGAGRGKIPNRTDISERPKTVEARARVGNWEGDLINGNHGTGHLVTLVERMTRFTLVAYSATKEAGAVSSVIVSLLSNLPLDMLRTLTFDNGKEFAKFAQLEQALGLTVYFAKPYHSWERGTNENRNGVVRKVLPKGSDFDGILEEEMRRIDYLLNDRPLRCLNWRTPREAFMSLVLRHLPAA